MTFKSYIWHDIHFSLVIVLASIFAKESTSSLLLLRRNFSLVARYSSKFTRCSLLVVKSLVTRSKIRSLLVVEVARCKNCSLLVAKSTRYSLQKLLVAKNHSLLVAEVARCKKSLVTRCKIRSLLVTKIHLLLIGLLISIATYYVKSLLTRANFS